MIRILIADDHAIFRQGLVELLAGERDIAVTASASGGKEALALSRSLRPDLMILDISMRDLDGLEVARTIREEGLPVKVVILSMHKDPLTVRKAFDLGVEGYVLKDEAFTDLAYAIRSVARGMRFFSPPAMSLLSTALEGRDRELLSPREKDVAGRIARGFTIKEIAADLGIGVKTVETHRQRIMDKLGCRKSAEIAAYAVKAGLVD